MITWDKAYLINLSTELERLKLSTAELDKWNIPFQRFNAIKRDIGKEGVRASQIAIMTMAERDNITPLIIEDDIIMQPAFAKYKTYLDALEKKSGGDWDVFFFYRDNRHQTRLPDEPLLLWGPTIALHFYMINKRALRQLIDICSSQRHAMDWAILNAAKTCKIKCYCTAHNLVCQDRKLKSAIKEGGYHKIRLGGILTDRK